MPKQYDAIVIGSGLGGLSTAASLSKRGVHVGLFEKHTQPGGYATSFFRDQFEFDVSLHALSGIGTPDNSGPLMRALTDLGVAQQLDFLLMEDLFRTRADGVDFTFPKGEQQSLDALCTAFPHEARGIKAFLKQIFRVGHEVDLFRDRHMSPSTLNAIANLPNLSHAAGMSVSQMLKRHIKDPIAQLVICQLWGYLGLPPSQLSFLLFAVALSSYIRYGSATLRGKSQSLSNAFVSVIRQHGGEVHLGCGVRKITAANGRITGIVTERDERFDSTSVISNADPITTVNQLMDPEQVPPSYRRRLNIATPGVSIFSVYLGLSKPSHAMGLNNHEVYLNDSINFDTQWQSCQSLGTPSTISLCSYDHTNPEFAPAGKGVAVLTALSQGSAWLKLNPEQYRTAKDQFAQSMMQRAATIYPELAANVETAVVSSPITNMRYTGNRDGAVYGFAPTRYENPGFRVDNQTPIPGLWLAGAWTRPGGGYQTVIMSGLNVARSLIKSGAVTSKQTIPSDNALPAPDDLGIARRLGGWGHILRDGKHVGAVVRTRHKKYSDAPFEDPNPKVSDQLDRFHLQHHSMRLTRRSVLNANCATLRFEPLEGTIPSFFAGQYFNLFVTMHGQKTNRPFSISSPPNAGNYLEMTIKEKESGYISPYLLRQLEVGDTVQMSGPYGDFHYNPLRDTKEIVAIGVGSGITPMKSILQDLSHRHPEVSAHLFVGARTAADLIFDSFFTALEQTTPRLKITRVFSQPDGPATHPTGRISGNLIANLLSNKLTNKTFFVCGPYAMYAPLVEQLGALGVPRRRIHLEAYGPPDDITRESNWPRNIAADQQFAIHLPGTDRTISARANEPILASLERAGVPHNAICRADVCDACTMELVSGNVFTPTDEVNLRTGHGHNKIHVCSCYPVSDLTLRD